MRLTTPHRGALLLCALSLAAPRAHAQDGTWALINARIETVTRGTIPRGTIVIRDGLIQAVGTSITPPSDARVVDLSGRTVYPGLIDLTSSMGIPSAPAGQAGGQGGPGGGAAQQVSNTSPPRNVGLEPGREIAEEINPSATELRGARDAGITTVLVAPTRGAFRGLSALIPMRDDSATRYIVRSPVALHMGFQGVPGRYPATLMGVIAYERQQLYDARHHALLLDRYKAGARGTPRPSYDVDLDALVPVVRGTLPAFFAASTENEMLRALRMGKEFDLALHVVGATEGFRVIPALRGARPPVVSVDFPTPSSVTGWSYAGSQRRALDDSARRDTAVRRVLEGNAATLHRAGIRFALASGALRPTDFMANVRKAIAAGLPRQVALEALTIRPAEIAGVGQQLGSVETGKIADLVVTEGELLTDSARVRIVFVDGIRHEIVAAPAAPRGRAAGGGAARTGGETAQLAGTWAVVTNGPQGSNEATMTVTQNGEALSGSMATEFGTFPISDGQVTGANVSWTLNLTMGGQTTPVVFTGTAEGARITGRAVLGGRDSMTFTAERKP